MIATCPQTESPVGSKAMIAAESTDSLHSLIRRFHFSHESIWAGGEFTVRCGRSPLARLIAMVLRFPIAGRSVPFTLHIDRSGRRHVWHRRFAGRALDAEFRVEGASAVERIGQLELRYTAAVERGALRLRSCGAALRVGGLAVPIPHCLTPRDRTRTWVRNGESRLRACIIVYLPFGGLLIAYRGWVEEVPQ